MTRSLRCWARRGIPPSRAERTSAHLRLTAQREVQVGSLHAELSWLDHRLSSVRARIERGQSARRQVIVHELANNLNWLSELKQAHNDQEVN